MSEGRDVARALLEVGALKFDSKVPFVYASHKIGPLYVDARQLSTDHSAWSLVVGELVELVKGQVEEDSIDLVSGGELADLLFSIPVAMSLGKPHLTIRKSPKGHGMGGRLVGKLRKGQRVVHVADMITMGTSALDWVSVIRGEGGRVSLYSAVFDRAQGGRSALEKAGVKVASLVGMDADFVSAAQSLGSLGEREAEGIRDYLADPEGWASSYLKGNPSFIEGRVSVTGGKLAEREGLDILVAGYPGLKSELGPRLLKTLMARGLSEPPRELA